jgi:hypothetical protein
MHIQLDIKFLPATECTTIFTLFENGNLIIPSILRKEYISLHDIYDDGEVPFQTGHNIASVVSMKI